MNEQLDLRDSDPEMPTPSDLGDVVTDLKLAFLVPPDEATARRHLATLAMAELLRGPSSGPPRRSRRRHRILIPLGVSGGLILATGGLAAAGVLPAPMQHAVAAIASPLGLDLPTDAPPGAPSRARSNPGDPTPAGPATAGGPDAGGSIPSAPAAPSQGAPGQGGTNPGKSDQAPGQQPDPGASGSAPGHGGTNPGKSDQAPGQQPDPGVPGSVPGHGGENPGTSGETHGPTTTI